MPSKAPYCVLAGLFSGQPRFPVCTVPDEKLTQIMKTPFRAFLAEQAPYFPRMESGRFTAFSEKAPFGKPGVLRGDRGL